MNAEEVLAEIARIIDEDTYFTTEPYEEAWCLFQDIKRVVKEYYDTSKQSIIGEKSEK